ISRVEELKVQGARAMVRLPNITREWLELPLVVERYLADMHLIRSAAHASMTWRLGLLITVPRRFAARLKRGRRGSWMQRCEATSRLPSAAGGTLHAPRDARSGATRSTGGHLVVLFGLVRVRGPCASRGYGGMASPSQGGSGGDTYGVGTAGGID